MSKPELDEKEREWLLNAIEQDAKVTKPEEKPAKERKQDGNEQ
jgi:hypothetical protein